MDTQDADQRSAEWREEQDLAARWFDQTIKAANERLTVTQDNLAHRLTERRLPLGWSELRDLVTYQEIGKLARQVNEMTERGRPRSEALAVAIEQVERELLEYGPKRSTDDMSRAISATKLEAYRLWLRNTARPLLDHVREYDL